MRINRSTGGVRRAKRLRIPRALNVRVRGMLEFQVAQFCEKMPGIRTVVTVRERLAPHRLQMGIDGVMHVAFERLLQGLTGSGAVVSFPSRPRTSA